jgi:hypothetical protein
MFYRYQQSLIDDATTTVAALLERAPDAAGLEDGIELVPWMV